jgi:hypothetical protein
VRNVIVVAVLVFCMAGIVVAKTPPAQAAPTSGDNTASANYHPQVSPDIAALQARERSALACGDAAGAREFEKQVQAILIQQQHVVSQSAPVVVVEPGCTGSSFTADQQIFTGGVSASSADWEMDGTMWAAFAGASDSTINVFKSLDHGASWNQIIGFYRPPKYYVDKIELVVGPGDSGFVYVFYNVPGNDGDLWVMRCDKNGGSIDGFAVLVGNDSITDFTACRDYTGSNYWLYAIAHNGMESGSWPQSFFLRSTDYGKTWATTDTFFNQDLPRMAFGAGWYGYVGSVPKQANWKGIVSTGVTTFYSGPGTWHFRDVHPDTFAMNDACIAPAFTTPPESATVWIAYTHNYMGTSDWDIYSAYAIGDTLLSWNGPTVIANTTNPEGYVDLKNYTSTGNDYVNVSFVNIDMTNGYDNAWLGYSSAGAPGTWTALSDTWVNKSVYSGWGFTAFPRIVYSPDGGGPGGGLVFPGYVSWTNTNGYFNAPWSNGVAESPVQPRRPAAAFSVLPSVARGPVRVSWNGSAIRLTVTDVAGRTVRSIAAPAGNSFVWDGKVPAGTYLVCLTTSSGTATRPVVIQQRFPATH